MYSICFANRGKKSYLVGNWGMDGPTKSNDALWYVPVRYVALMTWRKEDREILAFSIPFLFV